MRTRHEKCKAPGCCLRESVPNPCVKSLNRKVNEEFTQSAALSAGRWGRGGGLAGGIQEEFGMSHPRVPGDDCH